MNTSSPRPYPKSVPEAASGSRPTGLPLRVLLAPLLGLLAACAAQAPAQKQSAEAPASPSREEPVADDAEQSGASSDESTAPSPSAPAQAAAAPPAEPKEKGRSFKRGDALLGLSEHQASLLDSLRADALSCGGARPHRDAICEIARRICELQSSSPSTTSPEASCSEATQSCESAQRRFREKCGG